MTTRGQLRGDDRASTLTARSPIVTLRDMLHVGFNTTDITVFEPGIGLMGWGIRTHRAESVHTPLAARSSVFVDGESVIGFCVVDLLVVSQGLWLAVTDRLVSDHPETGLTAANTAIVATHTHCGPSGYGHHFLINLSSPGYSAHVFDALCDRITQSLVDAWSARHPSKLRVGSVDVPASDGLAFNRSWHAYNKNPENTAVSFEDRALACDQSMTGLVVDDASTGDPRGILTWFGLHGTCVHSDRPAIHPDHKGLAAMKLEASGIHALFAQECAGDVTHNHRPDKRRGFMVGRYDDDYETAEFAADTQARHARRLLEHAPTAAAETVPLSVATSYIDFADAPADAAYTHDGRPHRTTSAVLGLTMAAGTAEGPGPLLKTPWLTKLVNGTKGRLNRLRKGTPTDPKFPLVELGRGLDGKFANLVSLRKGNIPAIDPVFGWIRKRLRAGDIADEPWVPQRLPLQLLRVGPLVIASTPFELTTTAGRRLRSTLRDTLAPHGVTHIVVSTYANAYVGYLTTYEEYQVQHYEAAYTLFGPSTLAALRTGFADLARRLTRERESTPSPAITGPPPRRVPEASFRTPPFLGPWPD